MAWQLLEVFQSAERYLDYGKWFKPRGISYLFGVIVWVKVVCCFDYLSGSHVQSQVTLLPPLPLPLRPTFGRTPAMQNLQNYAKFVILFKFIL